MRRPLALVLAALVLLPGCTVSFDTGGSRQVAGPARPDALPTSRPPCVVTPATPANGETIRVAGCVAGAGGRPIARAGVRIQKHAGLGALVGAVLISAFSLGVGCVAEHGCDPGARSTTAETGNDGTFSIDVTPAGPEDDVTGAWLATTELPHGTVVTTDFRLDGDQVALVPAVHDWEPKLAVRREGSRLRFTWQPAPFTPQWGYKLLFYDTGDGQWDAMVLDLPADGVLDARLLGDADGHVAIVAEHGPSRYRGKGVPYAGRAKAISRGAPCWVLTRAGQRMFDDLNPCELTNGLRYDTVSRLQWCVDIMDDACLGPDDWMYVDLRAARAASLVVVAGASEQAVLEVSPDGRRWTPAAQAVEAVARNELRGLVAFAPPGGVAFRYLRVRDADERGLEPLNEISVFA